MTLLDLLPSLHRTAKAHLDPAVWPLTASVDESGRLCVGHVALTDIADEFGTPACVIDEADFRHRIRRHRNVLSNAEIAYAGESLPATGIARWVGQEHVVIDVRTAGEFALALAGGIDPKRIILHDTGISIEGLHAATAAGVGRIVVDSPTGIADLATEAHRLQPVLVRVTPDVDLTTDETVRRVLDVPQLNLVGLHCHLGEQVTGADTYAETIRSMIAAMADVRAHHGIRLIELNIDGGQGVRYVNGDAEPNLAELSDLIEDALDGACAAERFPRPRIVVGPGRAISARAAVTLCRVLATTTQPDGPTLVVVDGAVSDDQHAQRSGVKYTVALANRNPVGPTQLSTVAAQHCESGDEVARHVEVPADTRPGDLLAIARAGAGHHSDDLGRPPLISVHRGKATEIAS